MYRFKMAVNILSISRLNGHVTKIWKTIFQKEFFNEIWLKVGHKWNEIKKKNLYENDGQNNLCDTVQ